jgi:hypothetical protein
MTVALIGLLKKLIDRYEINGLATTLSIGLFFVFLIFTILMIFKDFKYIRIDTKRKIMTWYSPIIPWGRTVDLTKYIGKIRSRESGSAGGYSTGYLVDDTSTTRIKINGLFYKNFDELFSAVGLREIKNYDFNIWKYLKLIYTGRLKIKTNNKN